MVVVVAILATHAHADPVASVRDEAEREEGVTTGVDTSLRMRSDGAAVGVGVGAHLRHGDYALTVGVTRWQTLDDGSGSRGSWELGVRGYRYLQLGPRTRAHVTAGAAYESVEREGNAFGRSAVSIGAGLSTELADGVVGWMQLTVEHRHWLERPPTGNDDDELAVMLMLGLAF